MKKGAFKIYAGMGGSFSGEDFVGLVVGVDEKYALQMAYDFAVEAYEGAAGIAGIPTFEDIVTDSAFYGLSLKTDKVDDLDEADYAAVEEVYFDTIDRWIEYHVEEVHCEEVPDKEYFFPFPEV